MKRETSTYERIMFFSSRFKPMYFAFQIKLLDILSADQLKKTFPALRHRFPSSAVKVVIEPDKKQYVTTENVDEYPVTVEPAFADWRVVTAAELSKPFDDSNGPMVKFSLIHTDSTTDLVVFFQHSICDGISAVEFLKFLLRILYGSENYEMKTAPVWAPHLTHCLREDVYKQLQQCEIPDWVSKKNQFKTDILPLPQSVPYLEPTFEIKTSDLSVECTDLIVKKAAQWDVSVHSLLGGCILSVFASEYGRSLGYKRIIQSPVSFRRFIKEEFKDAFGIYMGIMKQAIDCAPGIDLCTTVKNIHATFKKQIESIELLKGYYQFMTLLLENVEDPETFFYNGPGPDPMDYDFSISNLGKIRLLSDKKGLVVDAHGPVFSAVDGERIFGVSTVNGKLSITMIYDDNCFCSKRADRILEKINQVFSSF